MPDTIRATQEEAPSGPDETRQRIIEAALQAFSHHGYRGATTRAIAAAAGVNEVTLFRHFGNKQNLLAAVIDRYSVLPDLKAILEGQLTGDYRQDLIHMGQHLLETLIQRPEMLFLMIHEARRQPELLDVLAQVPRQSRQLLATYLRQQMERGVTRELDPEVAAQAFFGMLFSQVLVLQLLGVPAAREIAPESLVTQFVDIFVRGTINR